MAARAQWTESSRSIAVGLERRLWSELREEVRIGPPEPFGDGHSGFTYAVDVERAGTVQRCVLRLSPPNVRIAGPADVGRQGRIMAALGAAGLPVPRVLSCASQPCVDGRAFLLMELVEGVPWRAALATTPRRALSGAAIGSLRRMQELDPSQTGIGDEVPASAASELARWSALLGRTESGREGQALIDALRRARTPTAARPCLVHGDFHLGNLLYDGASVAAILDWELAGLGDPLADLGCLAVASLRRRYAPDPNPTGFAIGRDELLGSGSGVDPERACWWIALTCLKYAAILAYNRELHRRGKRVDELYEHFDRTIAGLLEDGCTLAEGGIDVLDDGPDEPEVGG